MIDKKDEKILQVLGENARLSTQQISKRTLIPITTVHNRIKKLERRGIIRKYTIEVDETKLGKNVSAFVLAGVDYIYLKNAKMSQEDLAKSIKRMKGVAEISIIAGTSDLILKINVESIEELNDFLIRELRNIDGIGRTNAMVILKEL